MAQTKSCARVDAVLSRFSTSHPLTSLVSNISVCYEYKGRAIPWESVVEVSNWLAHDSFKRLTSRVRRAPTFLKWDQANTQGGCRGGAFFKEISLCVSVTSRLASVSFKMASKVFVEEMDQKLEFCTDKLFQFLTFGILTLGRTRGRGVMVRTTPIRFLWVFS